MKYIWYGSEPFDLNKVHPVDPKRYIETKIKGGLWGSPIEEEDETYFTWKDWCKSEDWELRPNSFKYNQVFEVDESKIYTVEDNVTLAALFSCYGKCPYGDNLQDICNNILLLSEDDDDYIPFGMVAIDYEKLIKDYSGLKVIHGDWRSTIHGYMNTWDCDSIVVWDKDIVKTVRI